MCTQSRIFIGRKKIRETFRPPSGAPALDTHRSEITICNRFVTDRSFIRKNTVFYTKPTKHEIGTNNFSKRKRKMNMQQKVVEFMFFKCNIFMKTALKKYLLKNWTFSSCCNLRRSTSNRCNDLHVLYLKLLQ